MLDDATLLALDRLVEAPALIDAGATIGAQADNAIVLLRGLAYRFKELHGGRRQILGLMFPGDICDGDDLLSMEYGVRAIMPVEIAIIPRSDLDDLASRDLAFDRAYKKTERVEAATLRTWIVNLGQRQAHERMAHFICEVAQRMAHHGLVLPCGRFEIPLTQHELADALGLTAVHVNRVLKRLRSEGLIDFQSGIVEIHAVDKLHTIAGFDPSHLN